MKKIISFYNCNYIWYKKIIGELSNNNLNIKNSLIDDMDKKLNRELELIKKIKGFDHVRFIFLYGSTANGNENKDSDIDLCIYYEGPEEEASRFRLRFLSDLSSDKYDVKIFQQLPLYIRKEVIKGKLLYSNDIYFVHEVAFDTIREFEYFKRFYYDYIGLEMIT